MNLKDSIYNVNKIHARLSGVERTRLHLFSNGLYNQLKAPELKNLKEIITSEYKAVISVIDKQLKNK